MDHELNRLTRRLHLDRDEGLRPAPWRPAAEIYRTRDGWLVEMELAECQACHRVAAAIIQTGGTTCT